MTKPLTRTALIAPCGMNCSICRAYLRDRNKCPGCRASDKDKPVSRVICKIRTCPIFSKSSKKYCFQCRDMPCDSLKHLDNRYRTRYGMSMIDNLQDIKRHGIRRFLKSETVRWTCTTCGGTVNVHESRCHSCGKWRDHRKE